MTDGAYKQYRSYAAKNPNDIKFPSPEEPNKLYEYFEKITNDLNYYHEVEDNCTFTVIKVPFSIGHDLDTSCFSKIPCLNKN